MALSMAKVRVGVLGWVLFLGIGLCTAAEQPQRSVPKGLGRLGPGQIYQH